MFKRAPANCPQLVIDPLRLLRKKRCRVRRCRMLFELLLVVPGRLDEESGRFPQHTVHVDLNAATARRTLVPQQQPGLVTAGNRHIHIAGQISAGDSHDNIAVAWSLGASACSFCRESPDHSTVNLAPLLTALCLCEPFWTATPAAALVVSTILLPAFNNENRWPNALRDFRGFQENV
jgi:hypothetical protein